MLGVIEAYYEDGFNEDNHFQGERNVIPLIPAYYLNKVSMSKLCMLNVIMGAH